MKKIVVALIFAGSLFAGSYQNPYYGNSNNNNNANYEGSSGTQYKYDLSNPSDRMNYNMDLDAQMNDKLNAPVTPGVGLDNSLGQYGGGIQKDR